MLLDLSDTDNQGTTTTSEAAHAHSDLAILCTLRRPKATFYYRRWENIDMNWIVIRQNFNFQSGKCQCHSSKNSSSGHIIKFFKNWKYEIAKMFLRWLRVERYKVVPKINSFRVMSRHTQCCSVTSRNCRRLYPGKRRSEKFPATAGFPAPYNPLDQF